MGRLETATNRADDQPWDPAYMNTMPGFNDIYASANRRRDEATAELQRMREANAMVPDAAAAMIALANTTAPGATAAVAPAAASDASGYNSDDTIGFPSPPPGGLAPQGSPVNDDDDRTPAEMGMVPFSPRFYETPDEDMGGDGVTGGAHDAERRALRVAKNDLAHRRRILTRFDTWEDDSWLDPDRSGPPNSNLNRLYDDTDLVDYAQERLMAARAEHAELGDNALDGSQLAEMLAGQGSALTITAY